MATPNLRRDCAKCDKGAGTAMCYGCERAFCTKHFIEHRQELSQQIDIIGQEHDDLRRDLTSEQGIHPLLTRINQWEQESIVKIQTTAESARAEFQQLLNTTKNNLKKSMQKMTEELQSNRDSDNYTEIDIKRWNEQLQDLRKMFDSSPNVRIDYENDTESGIRLIKLIEEQSSNSSDKILQPNREDNLVWHDLETNIDEKFSDILGEITLSENGLVATCNIMSDSWCCVSGIGRYSSAVHRINFRIERRAAYYPFLGIISSMEKLTKSTIRSTSCYGWWHLDYFVMDGRTQKRKLTGNIRAGDEVTLTLDCNDRVIYLQHHRTKRTVNIPIDLSMCAFPWKIIVLLQDKDDCVRILP